MVFMEGTRDVQPIAGYKGGAFCHDSANLQIGRPASGTAEGISQERGHRFVKIK